LAAKDGKETSEQKSNATENQYGRLFECFGVSSHHDLRDNMIVTSRMSTK
jgi:hypothetical protein